MKRRFKEQTNPVTAAESSASAQDLFDDSVSSLKDNFDYAVDGLTKLYEDGYQADAKELVEELKAGIDSITSKIAAIIAG